MTSHTELRRLAEGATPGPWKLGGLQSYDGASMAPFRCVYRSDAETHDTRLYVWGDSREALLEEEADHREPLFDCDADAAYIAAASPDTVIGLLDELTALKAENQRLRESLGEIDKMSQYSNGNPEAQLFAIQQIVRRARATMESST